MLKYLNPSNWSSLPSDVLGKGFGAQKKNILTSQFDILGVIFALIHGIIDSFMGLYDIVIVDLSIAVIFFVLYNINENAYHTTAKVASLLFTNIMVGFCAYFIPQKSSLVLFYLPLTCATLVGFGKSNPIQKLVFTSFPIVLLILSSFFLSHEFMLVKGNATEVYTILNILTAGIGLVAIVKFILDINYQAESQLRLQEEELRKMTTNISDQNVELKQMNTKLDRFVYSASHDMRAPLTSLLGLINLADQDLSPKKPNAYFDMMRASIQKLDSFIRDIIDFSRNSNLEIKNERIDFQSIYDEIVENLRFSVSTNNIEFTSDIDESVAYYSDIKRVKILLNNLISNAIKYRNQDNENHKIRFKVASNQSSMSISVEDNGMGIELEHQTKVFQMFHRASEKSDGSGLGLYIVNEIVEMLEGTISLSSQPLKGTKVTIVLPNKQ